MGENTLSDQELGRLPDDNEKAALSAMSVGVQSAFLGAPVLADVDRIVASEDWKDVALTIAAQPDVPRNLTVALTDVDNSVTGLLTITGKDAMGREVVETMAPDGAGGGKALVGTKIFAEITSAVITNSAGEATGVDVITIGVGDVIGLPVDIAVAACVVHAYLDGAKVSPTIATGVSESGIDASAGTYDGIKLLYALVNPNRLS